MGLKLVIITYVVGSKRITGKGGGALNPKFCLRLCAKQMFGIEDIMLIASVSWLWLMLAPVSHNQ